MSRVREAPGRDCLARRAPRRQARRYTTVPMPRRALQHSKVPVCRYRLQGSRPTASEPSLMFEPEVSFAYEPTMRASL
jgi:hypothetical protein